MSGIFTIVKTNKNGRETIEHGTALFPVQTYHDDFSVLDTVEWHWHPEFEAGIISRGHLQCMIHQKQFCLSEGDGFFINSETLHADFDREEHSCLLDSVVFHPRLVGGSQDSVFWQNYVNPVMGNHTFHGMVLRKNNPDDIPLLDAIRASIEHCNKKEPGYEFLVRNTLSELFYLVFQRQNQLPAVSGKSNLRAELRLKQMLSFIETHYQQDVTLQEIADSASISKSECIRCFRSTIGRTPIQFLKEYRLQKAANLLRSTDRNIRDIALACGFWEMSYFTRSFRAKYTVTPTEYRRQDMQP